MTAKARLIPIVAVSLVVLGGAGLRVAPARAEENCLAAPNRTAPQGSHWYYHLDRVKQSKCWYLRAEGPAMQKPAAQDESETSDATNAPAVTSKIAPDRTAQKAQQRLGPVEGAAPASGGQLTEESGQNRVRQANVGALAWPDSPSPARAGMVWPDPPAPIRPTAQSATAVGDPEERAQLARDLRPTAALRDEGALKQDRAGAQVGEPGSMEASQRVTPTSIILAGAIGLAIAAIVLRLIVRMTLARRRAIDAARPEPDWIDSTASERRTPQFAAQPLERAPGRVDGDHADDDVQQTLRILARVLDRKVA